MSGADTGVMRWPPSWSRYGSGAGTRRVRRRWRRALRRRAVPARWRAVGVSARLCWLEGTWFGWIVWRAETLNDAELLAAGRPGNARVERVVVVGPSLLGLPKYRRVWRVLRSIRRLLVWWFPGVASGAGAVEVVDGTVELAEDVVGAATVVRAAACKVADRRGGVRITAGLHLVVWRAVGLTGAAAAGVNGARERLDGLVLELRETAEAALAGAFTHGRRCSALDEGMDGRADRGMEGGLDRRADQGRGSVHGPTSPQRDRAFRPGRFRDSFWWSRSEWDDA